MDKNEIPKIRRQNCVGSCWGVVCNFYYELKINNVKGCLTTNVFSILFLISSEKTCLQQASSKTRQDKRFSSYEMYRENLLRQPLTRINLFEQQHLLYRNKFTGLQLIQINTACQPRCIKTYFVVTGFHFFIR